VTATNTIHAYCASLDVHKKTVVACVRRIGPGGAVSSEVCTFGTMTYQLLALSDWLGAQGVVHLAMESTRVYWKPIFNLLEGSFKVILVNTHRLKHVPGHKTDVKDSEWIAQLLQYGLLSPSFITPLEIRVLRDLTRQRT
jgi:transposase